MLVTRVISLYLGMSRPVIDWIHRNRMSHEHDPSMEVTKVEFSFKPSKESNALHLLSRAHHACYLLLLLHM